MDDKELALERARFWPCVIAAVGFVGAIAGGFLGFGVIGGDLGLIVAVVLISGGILLFIPMLRAQDRLEDYRERRRLEFLRDGPDYS
jgi:uncharacterized membrane protein